MFGNDKEIKRLDGRLDNVRETVQGHFAMLGNILDTMENDLKIFETIGDRLDALESEASNGNNNA